VRKDGGGARKAKGLSLQPFPVREKTTEARPRKSTDKR
jgi:hypothetical protein